MMLAVGAQSAPLEAADGSLAVCGDLSAAARDVAHHCRRALDGGLSDAEAEAARLNLADAFVALRQPSRALDVYNEAERAGSTRVELYIGRASALEALERRREAAADWRRAEARAPRSFDVQLGLGAFFLRAGDFGSALSALDAAVAIDQDDPDARYNRGLAHLGLSRFADAEADFSRLLRDDPNDAGAYLQRAKARRETNPRGALADLDDAIRLSPEWPAAWLLSGRLLDEAGRADDANFRLRRAFELGATDPWLLERLRAIGG